MGVDGFLFLSSRFWLPLGLMGMGLMGVDLNKITEFLSERAGGKLSKEEWS